MAKVNLETGEILSSFADFLGQRRADMSDEEYTKLRYGHQSRWRGVRKYQQRNGGR